MTEDRLAQIEQRLIGCCSREGLQGPCAACGFSARDHEMRSALLALRAAREAQCPHGENCACAITTRHEAFDWFCAEREKANAAREAQQQADQMRDLHAARLAECYRLTGADPDGNEDWRLAGYAVIEVSRLRDEREAAESALAEVRAALERYDENDSETSYYDAKEVCDAVRRALAASAAGKP